MSFSVEVHFSRKLFKIMYVFCLISYEFVYLKLQFNPLKIGEKCVTFNTCDHF